MRVDVVDLLRPTLGVGERELDRAGRVAARWARARSGGGRRSSPRSRGSRRAPRRRARRRARRPRAPGSPAPSPITKPSRRASNGSERPLFEVAPMAAKAAVATSVSAASAPPVTTASASPLAIIRCAWPIACAPAAQADMTPNDPPRIPRRIATAAAAALPISIGTASGETAFAPRSRSTSCCCSSEPRPPIPVPITQPTRSGVVRELIGPAGGLDRLVGGGDRELGEPVRAPRLLAREEVGGLELGGSARSHRRSRTRRRPSARPASSRRRPAASPRRRP